VDAVLFVAAGLIGTFAVFSVGALWGYSLAAKARERRYEHRDDNR